MKKAQIYITGQIGNSYNKDGTIAIKGVELQDVVAQVEEAKKADATIEGYDVIIKSLGGSIRVGKLIAKYVKSLPNCTTIADTECASMGTEIHLAVAKENRKIISGTKYSIHNPLMANVSGNALELEQMAEMIKENEKDMAKMYVSATGLSKDAVTGLMNQETSLTPEQCVTMGFCSEILPAPKLNAVAFFEPKTNNNLMKSIKELIEASFASFRKDLKIAEVAPANPPATAKVMNHTITEGELSIEMAGEVCAIGDKVSLNGTQAPAGDYTLEDGAVITVDEAGLVSNVKEVAAPDEMALLKAENETLKTTISTMQAEFEATLATAMTDLKAQIGSSFVPASGQSRFANTRSNVTKSVKELADERKALYKTKK